MRRVESSSPRVIRIPLAERFAGFGAGFEPGFEPGFERGFELELGVGSSGRGQEFAGTSPAGSAARSAATASAVAGRAKW